MIITSADVKARIPLPSSWSLSSDSRRRHVRHTKSFRGYFCPDNLWTAVQVCAWKMAGSFGANYSWTQFRHLRQLVEASSCCKVLNLLGVWRWGVNLISKASLQPGVFQHLFRHSSVRVRRCAKWCMLTHWGHFSQIIVECANCSSHTENLIYTGRAGAPWA